MLGYLKSAGCAAERSIFLWLMKFFKKLLSARLETQSQKTVLKTHCTKFSVLPVESVSSTFFLFSEGGY